MSNVEHLDEKRSYTITLDDDPIVHRMIEKALGLKSLSFSAAETFRSRALRYDPCAVFVDIHLDDGASGLELIPEIRERWPDVPILVITGDPSGEAVGRALASGAHDFVRKPLDPLELKARFQARSVEIAERNARREIKIADLMIDVGLGSLKGPLGQSHLSQADVRLLACLIEARGTTVSRDELRSRVWGNVRVSANAVDKKIFEVRQALKDVTRNVRIDAIYGKGLKIAVAGLRTEDAA